MACIFHAAWVTCGRHWARSCWRLAALKELALTEPPEGDSQCLDEVAGQGPCNN